ncbi:MAG: hypothetical protein QXR26_08705 [Candidatus Caldarchaeum sp.]
METQVRAEQEDTKVTVTLPIAAIVPGLNQPLSLSEIYMIATPVIIAAIVVASLFTLSKLRGKLSVKV